MNPTDLAFTPALEQAQLIRRKQISPLELVELYLERIQRLDPQLGSYFHVAAESALADARCKTEQLAATSEPASLPPFFGVPIAIKDLNPVASLPCSYGVAALRDQIASHDDASAMRLKHAGFVILGKTATSQVGALPYTEPEGFPPARNPWNLDYTPGGSSGGAAAAVAAGLCPVAQGSDGGGSIRGPASCCGIVGLKPSRGRISNAPVGDFQSGIVTSGPLTRTVADAAALLDVLNGYVTGDPYWLPEPDISFLEATCQNPGKLRIAFAINISPIGDAAPVCQQAVLDTVKLLENMGHLIEPTCLDFTALIEPFKVVWQAGVGASGIPAPLLEKFTRWLLETTGSAGDYLRAVYKMQAIAREIVAFFDNFDVLVLPVYMHPTIRVGEWASLSPEEIMSKIINWIAPSPPFNASGQPSIALPGGIDSNGLPVGIQLVGKPAAEATLLSLAAQIEAAKPWSGKRPAFAI
ncbi:MAG: amidase [Oscillatoriaceae bacterium SKW80]|nr:amidase [Oscillatoriaceae bacterium SKYG93]MCX8120991.1 amidase [Oscillatoriaceae bacterium SKW80]MDW8452264.1 amidase [Oscillatoriaceae cyanobacterium SKYGB_i_bin93]HIK26599.1 amidase [Oscillatoriaceae cyanobacterium M7585_C2015_266]